MYPNRPSLFLSLAFVFLAGCNDCESSASEGESEGLTPHGSVANAPDHTRRSRTADGLEVISAPPAPSRRPQHENLIREPNAPDPHGGSFSLTEAVDGLPSDGQLVAEFNTTFGSFFCDLYAERVPNTVANFIGLARGKRAWWDARAGQWRRAPAYDGTEFFRVMPDYMVQAGDYLDDGSGTVGYTIPDEPHPNLAHDLPGLLCMASTGPDENGAQFFITDGPAPQLDEDSQFTIFGRCRPEEMVHRMARVPQADENRPRTPITIQHIRIRRVSGGAANARVTPPRLPDGVDPERLGLEASPGPSELNIPEREREQNRFNVEEWRRRTNMRARPPGQE